MLYRRPAARGTGDAPTRRIDALTYCSEAANQLTQDALECLLLRSRELNAARAITGVLVVCGRDIVQYLEGPSASLARTFPSIAASPLHRDVRPLARAERVARRFDQWHMGSTRFQPMQAHSDEAREWLAILAMLRANPAGNAAFDSLLDRWDSIARPAAQAGRSA